MRYKGYIFLFLCILAVHAAAQKPFTEGTIVYKVKLISADKKEFSGTYTFVIKGGEIKKELKLANGYEDVVLLNCDADKAYSLQNRNGRKFAIQLDMNEMRQKQQKFAGYSVTDEESDNNAAGYAVYKGSVSYHDGTAVNVRYIKELRPLQGITFERFPDAKFLPASFSYEDENNMVMQFEVQKVEPGPVENAVFRIPADYKMISNSEYRQLSR